HVCEGRKHEPETFSRLRDRACVVREHRIDRTARAAAAAAEGDTSVRSGAEVTQRGAKIADQLAAGPTDLLKPFRRRGREHDVAAPCDDPAVELGPPDSPRIDC